jgi:hypothetical protein
MTTLITVAITAFVVGAIFGVIGLAVVIETLRHFSKDMDW